MPFADFTTVFSADCSTPSSNAPKAPQRSPGVRQVTVAARAPDLQSAPQPQMEGFAVTCPLAPDAPRLLSGFCSPPRSFGFGFLQTPPRGDALAVSLAFGSAKTWLSDSHRHSYVPCPAHTLPSAARFSASAAAAGWAALTSFHWSGFRTPGNKNYEGSKAEKRNGDEIPDDRVYVLPDPEGIFCHNFEIPLSTLPALVLRHRILRRIPTADKTSGISFVNDPAMVNNFDFVQYGSCNYTEYGDNDSGWFRQSHDRTPRNKYTPLEIRRTFPSLTRSVRHRRTQHWYLGCCPERHGCK
jgi:hypothetical protein